jgi:SAM-dependent methyltransferase
LAVQARLIEPITRRFLVEAGVGSGMHVLDVGSGAGDVAFLIAELVGSTGSVVGVDRSETALDMARKRSAERGLANVTFVEGDPAQLRFGEPFEAVVGRYVLMFQPDPVALLRGVLAHVRSGGVAVFHEPYRDGVRSFPPVPTYDRGWQLVDDTFRATGADPTMGIKLHATFVAAGLPSPTMRMESVIAGGADCSDNIHFEVDPVRSLLPEIVRLGLATPDEIDIHTYADRVRDELVASGGVIVGRSEVGAWSRVP